MSTVLSTKRPLQPVSFEFNENLKLTATGAVNINIPFIVNHVDFFTSSFKIDLFNKTVFIDPLIIEDKEQADFILITHAHQDHFSINDIRKLLKSETVVICPKNVYKKLNRVLKNVKLILTKPGQENNFGKITIQAVPACNLKSGLLTPHPRSALNVGYIISANSFKLYHAGDTDYLPEMEKLQDLAVILTPIDGGKLTMSTEKAAELVNKLKPKYAIPMHYNLGTNQPGIFAELVDSSIKVLNMDGQNLL